jgi:hypothetical protein
MICNAATRSSDGSANERTFASTCKRTDDCAASGGAANDLGPRVMAMVAPCLGAFRFMMIGLAMGVLRHGNSRGKECE